MTDNSNINELAEWILHYPSYTKADMIEKIEQAIPQELLKARIDELNRYDTDEDMYKTLRTVDLQNQVQAS